MNIRGKDIKIFTANSNPRLAADIARDFGTTLGKSEITHFSDGEINVKIDECVRGSDVFLVQSTCFPVNKHMMELLIMLDAFKRASAGRITAVIPYYGYARQDRKAKPRQPISARLMADLITTAGADHVLTMDWHAPQIQGFFSIPTDHLQGAPLLVNYFKQKFTAEEMKRVTVVAPDLGSVTRTRKFAEAINAPIAIIDKRRPKANVSEVMNIIGDVKDRITVMIDDIIDTGGSLCNAASALVDNGAAAVFAGASHGVLSGDAVKNIEKSPIEKVVLLDTIPLSAEAAKSEKIEQCSVAHLFYEAILCIHNDHSISRLFT